MVRFVFILTAMLLVLKIFGLTKWGWWWIFSPMWITGIVLYLFAASSLYLATQRKRKGIRTNAKL